MNIGDIYMLKEEFKNDFDENQYNHAFVYLGNNDSGINGLMLTTSNKKKFKNIPMKKEHFNEGFDFTFGKSEEKPVSYIVPLNLIKSVEYSQLNKVGELTELGIDFIEEESKNLEITTWSDYIYKIRKQ
ncbi:hypothetical protein [Empedobacter brevis]|uniref:hypothetical protein n=1 Tax=Empedobacter brevis TaxID=247 RepID=UPI00289EF378|nr:hypothetical protein [Empedobacter brevis]